MAISIDIQQSTYIQHGHHAPGQVRQVLARDALVPRRRRRKMSLGHSGGSRWGETHDVMEVPLYRWMVSWNIPTANWMRTGGILSDLGSPFFFWKAYLMLGKGEY